MHDDKPDLKTILVEAIREANETSPLPDVPPKPAKHKPATVNECMAGMLLEDASRVGWPARKWAVAVGDRLKRNVTDGAVKQTDVWKKQIIPGRKLMQADKAGRKR